MIRGRAPQSQKHDRENKRFLARFWRAETAPHAPNPMLRPDSRAGRGAMVFLWRAVVGNHPDQWSGTQRNRQQSPHSLRSSRAISLRRSPCVDSLRNVWPDHSIDLEATPDRRPPSHIFF
jgi:hypothetical protein